MQNRKVLHDIPHSPFHIPMRILFVGGGSIGHLAPAVAVWRAVEGKDPRAEAHFLCAAREDERRFLIAEKVPFTEAPLPRRSLSLPLQFHRAYRTAKKTIAEFRPDVVFSKGGAVSLPACLAAHIAKIPIVLHESDAVSGMANRIAARWAEAVCLGFPHTQNSKLKTKNFVITGNPIRPHITEGSKKEALTLTGFSGKRPVLLVLGGSQGAEIFNTFIERHLSELLGHCDVVHITGRGKSSASDHVPGYWADPFALGHLADFYALATVALSRAGAGSIAELAGNGIPTILVSLTEVAQNHQQRNAEIAAQSGGCILLPQEHLEDAARVIKGLLKHPDTMERMSRAIGSLHRPDAAAAIAAILGKAAKT